MIAEYPPCPFCLQPIYFLYPDEEQSELEEEFCGTCPHCGEDILVDDLIVGINFLRGV